MYIKTDGTQFKGLWIGRDFHVYAPSEESEESEDAEEMQEAEDTEGTEKTKETEETEDELLNK